MYLSEPMPTTPCRPLWGHASGGPEAVDPVRGCGGVKAFNLAEDLVQTGFGTANAERIGDMAAWVEAFHRSS